MKLLNKRTGEIVEDAYVRETHDFQFDGQKHILAVFRGNGHRPPERISGPYNSLAELNEEWEDYEEPKRYWYINCFGIVIEDIEPYTKKRKEDLESIGNYFETKEEAEKAVEKLKAWKRLKDKGFEFRWIDMQTGQIKYSFFLKEGQKVARGDEDDLLLLFGGEE